MTATARALPTAPALGAAGLGAGLLIGAAVLAGYAAVGPLALVMAATAAAGAILVLLFGAERVLVSAILLNLPLQLDVYVGYRVDEATLGALGGVPVSITTVSLLLLLLRRVALTAVAGAGAKERSARALVPLALFVALSALSVLAAGDRVLAAYGLLLLVQSLVLYVCLAAALRTAADVRWAVGLLLVGLVIEAGFMVLQRAGLQLRGLLSAEAWPTQVGTDIVSRFSGTLGSPNAAAAYLSVILVIALAVVLSRPGPRQMALAGAALAAGGIGLVVTFSRGGTLAFGVGAATLAALAGRRRLLRAGPLLAVAAAFALLAVTVGDELLARFVRPDAGAAGSRLPLMAIALRMIGSAPVTGVGLNNFVTALPDFVTPEFSREWLYVVHNYYLQIASEVGLLGLVAFLAFLARAVRSGWAASKGLPDEFTFLALGTVSALVARAVHMNFDLAGQPVQWESLVILAALAAALLRQSDLRPAPASRPQHQPLPAREEYSPPAGPEERTPQDDPIPEDEAVGTRLGDRYELGTLLGQGRAARVHRARDLLLDREVAVKVLRVTPQPAERRRMLRAARAGARVGNRHLMPVHDLQGGRPAFLVLDLLEGRRLSDLLRDGLAPERARVIAQGVLTGLAALHREGVVHREVVADNVIVDLSGRAVLSSAGLARAASDPTLGLRAEEGERAAPEQELGPAPDERSDVYAAGLLLQALLPSPSPAVHAVLRRALAEDLDDRYRDAGALRAALKEALR